jgi:hypothetical protein
MTMLKKHILRGLMMACAMFCAIPVSAMAAQVLDGPEPIKPRVIILTDVLNEPDDSQSLIRALLYSNDIDIRGLVATTSTWQRTAVHPEEIRRLVTAYEGVLPNLRVHSKDYPSGPALQSVIRAGRARYGMSGVDDGPDTEASQLIIREVDSSDSRPLWICVWGGAVDLAQALYHVRHTRSPEQVEAFESKLRVYSISDQDDAGPWIRASFPKIFWIASIHAFSDYTEAAWQGMSADTIFPDSGPDTSLMREAWLNKHIRVGPFGSLYPKPLFAIEGDSPSFLYLIPNGLGDTEHPEYGSWGGRYGAVSPQFGLYADTQDTAMGADGKPHEGDRVGIWRWRDAAQADFANRMQWTVASAYKLANHPPHVVLQDDQSLKPLEFTVKYGEKLHLSAAGTTDPDGDGLTYKWWWYRDPSPPLFPMSAPDIVQPDGIETDIILPGQQIVPGEKVYHIILEVRDLSTADRPAIFRYRRAVIHVLPQ